MLGHSLQKVRSWDFSAFGDLYDASYEKIYRFIYHRTLDTYFTEDVISDVYMKAIESIGSFKGNTDAEFFAWMYRIAYTTLIDTLRKSRWEDSLEDMEIEPGFTLDYAHEIDTASKLEEILRFMETLPERDSIILTMRIWDDLSYDEIATITGISVVNAKQIVSRTLVKISANVTHLFIFSILLYVIQR